MHQSHSPQLSNPTLQAKLLIVILMSIYLALGKGSWYFFLAMLSGMQNLSSPTRDQTHAPAVEVWNPNHKTTKEFPGKAVEKCWSGQLGLLDSCTFHLWLTGILTPVSVSKKRYVPCKPQGGCFPLRPHRLQPSAAHSHTGSFAQTLRTRHSLF